MTLYLLALLIGIVAGLRALTAPAAISWAACCGGLHLQGSWLAFLGYAWTPWILSVLALGEPNALRESPDPEVRRFFNPDLAREEGRWPPPPMR